MSASLVGSEMCIRDRQLAASKNRPSQLERGSNLAQSECIHGVGLHAVSYTHLTLPTICSV
eukprot:13012324-Alexandrium_andersonii.AAC.1